jgi:hypothetical protein
MINGLVPDVTAAFLNGQSPVQLFVISFSCHVATFSEFNCNSDFDRVSSMETVEGLSFHFLQMQRPLTHPPMPFAGPRPYEAKVTRQTQRDHGTLAWRICMCAYRFGKVKSDLRGHSKAELLHIVYNVSIKHHLQGADRLCHRQFDALVCWFAHNISYIMLECPGLLNISANIQDPDPSPAPELSEFEIAEPDFDPANERDIFEQYSEMGDNWFNFQE